MNNLSVKIFHWKGEILWTAFRFEKAGLKLLAHGLFAGGRSHEKEEEEIPLLPFLRSKTVGCFGCLSSTVHNARSRLSAVVSHTHTQCHELYNCDIRKRENRLGLKNSIIKMYKKINSAYICIFFVLLVLKGKRKIDGGRIQSRNWSCLKNLAFLIFVLCWGKKQHLCYTQSTNFLDRDGNSTGSM